MKQTTKALPIEFYSFNSKGIKDLDKLNITSNLLLLANKNPLTNHLVIEVVKLLMVYSYNNSFSNSQFDTLISYNGQQLNNQKITQEIQKKLQIMLENEKTLNLKTEDLLKFIASSPKLFSNDLTQHFRDFLKAIPKQDLIDLKFNNQLRTYLNQHINLNFANYIPIEIIDDLDSWINEVEDISESNEIDENLNILIFKNQKQSRIQAANQIIECYVDKSPLLLLHNFFLTSLPNNVIGKLIWLNTLDISNNQIINIPEDIKNLNNLKYFNLAANNIHEVQEHFFDEFTQLEMLNLSFNPLFYIPLETLSRLAKLYELILEQNEIAGSKIYSHS